MAWVRHESAPLFEVERALRHACSDARLAGVIVHLDELTPGWSKAESLHRALLAVRRSGKLVVAVATTLDNASYVVASAAELVLLHPSSILAVQALAAERFFVTDLLGELGARPELEHVGEFKSAGEAFTRRSASEEHQLETRAILEDLDGRRMELVSEARGLSFAEVEEAHREGPLLPEEALRRRLVDRLAGEEALDEVLEERLGPSPRRVPLRAYARRRGPLRRLWQIRRRRVAVVHASGLITLGEGRLSRRGSATIEARALGETLRKLREDARVGAVVLRIESPGGGAVASDWIRAELAAVAAKKPVVVSMGDVAASGGYLIATAAHAVLAEATTLTGSIGVIGGKVNLGPVLDRLGIRRETQSTGDNAGFFSPLRAFTPEERARYRALLAHFYENRFLPAVAEGRKLSREQADAAGRGRVWTGRQGLANGLVDRLGGLGEAIELALERAGLRPEKAPVVYVSRRRRLRELLRHGLGAAVLGPDVGIVDGLAAARALLREEILLIADRFPRIR